VCVCVCVSVCQSETCSEDAILKTFFGGENVAISNGRPLQLLDSSAFDIVPGRN